LRELGRIPLPGSGALDIRIDGETAWVAMADSGDAVEVDLAHRTAVETVQVGDGPGHIALSVDRVYAGGLDASVASIDRTSGAVEHLGVGPVEGLSADGDNLWALQKTGRVVKLNGADGDVLGSASIHIDSDAHANLVAYGGSAWASGDRTDVSRISGDPPALGGTIDTGGGIPFAFANGQVFGARPDMLWTIDPATDAIASTTPLTGLMEILALDVDGQVVWLTGRQPGRVGVVVRLNLDTGERAESTAISLPAGVAIGSDTVWVTSYETNELVGFAR